MRIRSIKPEFWRSDDIDALDWHNRLLFIGLWSYVDDNGVGRDKVANIAADIFAGDLSVDPTETLRRVSLGLDTLHAGGQIDRYKVSGKAYLHVVAWERHQLVKNPNKQRYPLPTCGNAEPTEALPRVYGDSTETLPTGAGEQGSRGTEEKTPSSAAADGDFDEWWSHYPRKVGKQAALKAYRKAHKQVGAKRLLDALTAQLPVIAAAEPRFQPHPATWLNEGRWDDELAQPAKDDDGGWFRPFSPPPCPPEIADDPLRYQRWIDEQAAEWKAGGGR